MAQSRQGAASGAQVAIRPKSLVGQQLAFLRRQRGWSQRDLSHRTGVHQPEISRIEAGVTAPTEATLERLASALGYRLALTPAEVVQESEGAGGSAVREAPAEQWRDRIWTDPGKRSGQPVIRGMRITVRDILEYLAGGMTPEEIIEDFPELEVDDISAALAYAAAHLEPMPA